MKTQGILHLLLYTNVSTLYPWQTVYSFQFFLGLLQAIHRSEGQRKGCVPLIPHRLYVHSHKPVPFHVEPGYQRIQMQHLQFATKGFEYFELMWPLPWIQTLKTDRPPANSPILGCKWQAGPQCGVLLTGLNCISIFVKYFLSFTVNN